MELITAILMNIARRILRSQLLEIQGKLKDEKEEVERLERLNDHVLRDTKRIVKEREALTELNSQLNLENFNLHSEVTKLKKRLEYAEGLILEANRRLRHFASEQNRSADVLEQEMKSNV